MENFKGEKAGQTLPTHSRSLEALQFRVGEYPLRVKIFKYLGRNSNRRTSGSGQGAKFLGKWLLSPLVSLGEV